jgi:hypothetical protein
LGDAFPGKQCGKLQSLLRAKMIDAAQKSEVLEEWTICFLIGCPALPTILVESSQIPFFTLTSCSPSHCCGSSCRPPSCLWVGVGEVICEMVAAAACFGTNEAFVLLCYVVVVVVVFQLFYNTRVRFEV